MILSFPIYAHATGMELGKNITKSRNHVHLLEFVVIFVQDLQKNPISTTHKCLSVPVIYIKGHYSCRGNGTKIRVHFTKFLLEN